MSISITNAVANPQADALSALMDNGWIRIYGGAVPVNAEAPLGGAVLLAEHRLAADAAPPAVAGVLTANAITDDLAANATGTPTFFRVFAADGVTVLWQGTAGLAPPADLVLASLDFQAGTPITMASLQYTVPKG